MGDDFTVMALIKNHPYIIEGVARFLIWLGVCWWICSETLSAFFHPEGVPGSRRLDRGHTVAETLGCFLSSASGERF